MQCFGGTVNVAKLTKGSPIDVFGLGAMGLSACEGARYAGASRTIRVDLNPARFDKGLGAVWNTAKVETGSIVAIFGLGTVGLADGDETWRMRCSLNLRNMLNPFDMFQKFLAFCRFKPSPGLGIDSGATFGELPLGIFDLGLRADR